LSKAEVKRGRFFLRKGKLLSLIIGITLLGLFYPNTVKTTILTLRSSKWSSEFRPYGGYVDEVRFVIYPYKTETPQAMLALQNGDIDAYDERVLQDYLAALIRDPNIEVTFTPSVRYRALTLNCEKFPLNITAFRRAMAFGFDKYRANVECIGGVGQPQDSFIPQSVTEWEVESKIIDHFYEADYISGNRSMENAGFIDLDGDGWREYDADGSNTWTAGDLDDDEYVGGGIMELYATAGYDPAIRVCDIMVEGLEEMGVRSETYPSDFLPNPPPDIWDFPVHCWTEGISVVNPSELLYDNFRTGAKWNKYPYNFYHFSNSTIDAVLDQMVEATTPDDIKIYAREANRLLTFEQPQIVVYNDVNIGAHRTDRFDGWFEFVGVGPTTGGYRKNNPYCAIKVHLKEEWAPWGETLNYGLSEEMGTLNHYLQKTRYEETVFQYIYETLWNIDPNTWDPIPGLAYDWDIEPTITNGDVQDGQKFTFYLYENETWHDGTPFTSADVNHSLHMWRNSPEHEPDMWDIYNVTIPNDYTIELYVNETGYFEWADTTHFYITPEHIWHNVTDVSEFNPADDQIIGTGPYKWNEYVPGEYIILLRHEDWRWDIRDTPPMLPCNECWTTTISTPTPRTSITTTSQTSITISTPGFTSYILLVMILGVLLFKQSKRDEIRKDHF
jgi:ABC-type transport system substrate-binding protein